MLTFWIYVTERDVERFCATLLLPDYMSHLRIAPFRFEDQPNNPDGRQSLIATYIGDGRLEEYPIHPEKHALDLLRYIVPDIRPGCVAVASHEAIWSWANDDGQSGTAAHVAGGGRMRLFFHTVDKQLGMTFPPRFQAESAYVSISRRELFLGTDVVVAFLAAWIEKLRGVPVEAFTEPADMVALSVEIEPIASGIAFRCGPFGGLLQLEDDAVFEELIHFSGLQRPLQEIGDRMRLNLDASEVRIDTAGITFLLSKSSEGDTDPHPY